MGRITASNNFVLRIYAGVVVGHLEHAKMEVGDGRKTTAGNEDERSAVGVILPSQQPVRWESVVVQRHGRRSQRRWPRGVGRHRG